MLVPINKYLVVEPVEDTEEKPNTTILIPENIRLNDSPYTVVKLIRACEHSELKRGLNIIVPTHVVDSCAFNGKTYHLVLENHVIGYLSEDNG